MTDPTRGYTPGGFPRLASGKAKIPARPATEGRHDEASEVASAVMLVDRLLRPVLSDQETP